MAQPLKNTAALFAILAGLISIPLSWMTIYGAQFTDGAGNRFPIPIDEFKVLGFSVTGINGSFTFLFETPIWFLVGIAISANVLQLMHNSTQFAIPSFAEWATALFGFIGIGLGICVALFSDKVTLGIGSLMGLFCAGVALLCLVVPTSDQQDSLMES
ncbi:hypothetical protein [uncultured Gimesia sp.]|uniref:hypothetical protein n=1 Tax=uncultured Gimesia sp. TaxID=1678688 RepID=UPI0030DB6579|tara:strand:+ start:37336 stop:37809 length:474 start_codon:yes stop_codon:yes gene_type:complete